MTDLESPRKNNDCYFYYYSTCTKGDDCTFRHEPSALGCETTCSFWKEGKCINVHCNFRHMELRKNRKTIPCYWESQPGGCKKPHCPFMHAPKSISEEAETTDLKSSESKSSDICIKKTSQVENNFGSPVVDPLVVNFEEESDNESAPTQSPVKTQRIVKVKTLEEIKLERIQAESAAYYSYPDVEMQMQQDEAEFIRKRMLRRMTTKQDDTQMQRDPETFEILSLDEIRKRKREPEITSNEPTKIEPIEIEANTKKQKINLNKKPDINLNTVKIKTLDEIRAERSKRFGTTQVKRKLIDSEPMRIVKIKKKIMIDTSSESEVSSTSIIDSESVQITQTDDLSDKVQCLVLPIQRLPDTSKMQETILDVISEVTPEEVVKDSLEVPEDTFTNPVLQSIIKLDSSKMDDLLLEEDEFEGSSVSLRAEEDILNDIDNLLNE